MCASMYICLRRGMPVCAYIDHEWLHKEAARAYASAAQTNTFSYKAHTYQQRLSVVHLQVVDGAMVASGPYHHCLLSARIRITRTLSGKRVHFAQGGPQDRGSSIARWRGGGVSRDVVPYRRAKKGCRGCEGGCKFCHTSILSSARESRTRTCFLFLVAV